MGLLDSVKAGAKNALNKTEEEVGTMRIKSSISTLREENERRYNEIGKKYHNNRRNPYPEFQSEMDVACKAIEDNEAKIAELEKQLEEYKQTHKDEREANRQAAIAASEEKKEEKKKE